MVNVPKVERNVVIYESKRLAIAVFGTFLYALGMNLFVVPLGLYTGGIMGICQLIRTLLIQYLGFSFGGFDISGLIYYIINIPLFIVLMKRVGRRFFAKTLICVTSMSFFLFAIPIPHTALLEDVLASCLIAGLICGGGIGLTLKMGSSNGGTDALGILLIRWRKDFSVGKVSMFVNFLLYGICLFLFDIQIVIYSVIYAAVSAFAVDKAHSQNINVEVKIITKKNRKEMEKEIFAKMERGITEWESLGAYTDEESAVLYILISKYEIGRLKHIVLKHDPGAFIVFNEGVRVEGHFLKRL